jgi:hypothetical protein
VCGKRGATTALLGQPAAGLGRYQTDDTEEEGEDGAASPDDGARRSDQGRGASPGRPAKRPRAASAGVLLAAAAVRGGGGGGHHAAAHHSASPPAPATPPLAPFAAGLGDAFDAALPGPAPLRLAPTAPPTPAASHDSGRSSTCPWQVHRQRRKGEPARAPMA